MHYTINFPTGQTDYYLNSNYSQLLQLAPVGSSIIVTDEHIQKLYGHLFAEYRVLIIPAGEGSKSWKTIYELTEKLARFEAHKKTKLIGIGGGVVTDIVGFLATIYMRGIEFAFVPTTLLGMVDASIGGKSGINVGLYKNMLGSIQQPKFILFDTSFLETLAIEEWSNGFAEIIKYACIQEPLIFDQLMNNSLNAIKLRKDSINALIERCVEQKNRIVLADEQEKTIRKTLNFGHTAGHAFETLYHLAHGQAVALGMIVALIASEQKLHLPIEIRQQFIILLKQYSLATHIIFDINAVLNSICHDKKRNNDFIDFILIESIGKAVITPLSFDEIRAALTTFADEHKS